MTETGWHCAICERLAFEVAIVAANLTRVLEEDPGAVRVEAEEAVESLRKLVKWARAESKPEDTE